MQRAFTLIAFVSSVLLCALSPAASAADAAPAPLLSGSVTSQEEGPMEGVLVSAKRADSPITTTVVSDAKGNFRFPADRIAPGTYTIRIRAAGYDLESSAEVRIEDRPATHEIRLRKTRDLAAQLTNAEWMT